MRQARFMSVFLGNDTIDGTYIITAVWGNSLDDLQVNIDRHLDMLAGGNYIPLNVIFGQDIEQDIFEYYKKHGKYHAERSAI